MITKDNYANDIKPYQPKPKLLKNCLKAFVVGGIICAIGQGLTIFYIEVFGFTEKTAGNPVVTTLILLQHYLLALVFMIKLVNLQGQVRLYLLQDLQTRLRVLHWNIKVRESYWVLQLICLS